MNIVASFANGNRVEHKGFQFLIIRNILTGKFHYEFYSAPETLMDQNEELSYFAENPDQSTSPANWPTAQEAHDKAIKALDSYCEGAYEAMYDL